MWLTYIRISGCCLYRRTEMWFLWDATSDKEAGRIIHYLIRRLLCKSLFSILEDTVKYQKNCFHSLEHMNVRRFGNAINSVHDWHVVDQMKGDPFLSWAFELGQCSKTCSCKWWWWWQWWSYDCLSDCEVY